MRTIAACLLAAAIMGLPVASPAAGVASVPSADTTTARVTKVIDGDTLRTTKGTIRLIGVDTPEVGRCNAAKATRNARRLVPVGSVVRLALPSGQNARDAYSRKLRYVTRNGVDLGAAQIKAGVADARYDSRDGYPRHPKQVDYRRWDARYPDKPCGADQGSGTSSGGTYTGCRAYGPNGTSTDDQGRLYTKIDCTTKQPL
jgi:endonuclease YncB( thermonuclease family)